MVSDEHHVTWATALAPPPAAPSVTGMPPAEAVERGLREAFARVNAAMNASISFLFGKETEAENMQSWRTTLRREGIQKGFWVVKECELGVQERGGLVSVLHDCKITQSRVAQRQGSIQYYL